MVLEGFTDVSSILRSGVYALCARGEVIYVGKSKAMIARINTHRRAWIDKRRGQKTWITDTLGIPGLRFDQIWIRWVAPHELDAVEREMINKYKPRYNIALKNREAIAAPITLNIGGAIITMNAIAVASQSQPQVIRRR